MKRTSAWGHERALIIPAGHPSNKVTYDIYSHLWDDPASDQAIATAAENPLLADRHRTPFAMNNCGACCAHRAHIMRTGVYWKRRNPAENKGSYGTPKSGGTDGESALKFDT